MSKNLEKKKAPIPIVIRDYDKIQEQYKEIRKQWAKEKNINLEAVPKITKIVISSCCGNFFRDKKKFESIRGDMRTLGLQEPLLIRAKKSVSSFTLREGMDLAYKISLRRNRMMYFLHRLIYFGWINDRNFYGVDEKAISGHKKSGFNLNFGLKDISLFPEIPKSIERQVGVGIVICTNGKTKGDCKEILERLNIPFRNKNQEDI